MAFFKHINRTAYKFNFEFTFKVTNLTADIGSIFVISYKRGNKNGKTKEIALSTGKELIFDEPISLKITFFRPHKDSIYDNKDFLFTVSKLEEGRTKKVAAMTVNVADFAQISGIKSVTLPFDNKAKDTPFLHITVDSKWLSDAKPGDIFSNETSYSIKDELSETSASEISDITKQENLEDNQSNGKLLSRVVRTGSEISNDEYINSRAQEIVQYKETISKLKKQLEELKNNKVTDNINQKVTSDFNELNEKYNRIKEDYDKQNMELIAMRVRLDQLSIKDEELVRLKQDNMESSQLTNQLQQELTLVKNEKEVLQKQIELENKNHQNLRSANEKLEKNMAVAVKQADLESEKYTKTINNLQKSLEVKSNEVNETLVQNEQLASKFKGIKEKYEALLKRSEASNESPKHALCHSCKLMIPLDHVGSHTCTPKIFPK